jgi:hypothetical protein
VISLRGVLKAGIGFVLILGAGGAEAQEFEPRTYAVAPVGLNFVGIGYGLASGGVFMDPALPVRDVEGDVHIGVVRYVRTLSIFGLPSKVKLALPYSSGHWEGFLEDEFRIRDASGLADARIIVETMFSGAEVMTPAEMRGYRPGTVFGARLQVVAPTGAYDNTKVINLGANRWSFVPEIGMSTPLGKWSIEAAVGAWLFTDNDDFFDGRHLAQDPLLVAKLLGVRSIRPGFWVAIASGFGYGGRTSVDGVPRATLQRNWRIFAMVAYPITPRQGVTFSVGSGGNRGAGTDFDSMTVGYQYSWGGS